MDKRVLMLRHACFIRISNKDESESENESESEVEIEIERHILNCLVKGKKG